MLELWIRIKEKWIRIREKYVSEAVRNMDPYPKKYVPGTGSAKVSTKIRIRISMYPDPDQKV